MKRSRDDIIAGPPKTEAKRGQRRNPENAAGNFAGLEFLKFQRGYWSLRVFHISDNGDTVVFRTRMELQGRRELILRGRSAWKRRVGGTSPLSREL